MIWLWAGLGALVCVGIGAGLAWAVTRSWKTADVIERQWDEIAAKRRAKALAGLALSNRGRPWRDEDAS